MQLKNGHTKGENMRSISILFPLLLLACAEKDNDTSNQESSEQDWWQTEEGTESEKTEDNSEETKEDYSEEDKEDYSEEDGDEDKEDGDEDKEDSTYNDCPVDFDSTTECTGSWEDTICITDELIWWCQDGVWMNENEKEE